MERKWTRRSIPRTFDDLQRTLSCVSISIGLSQERGVGEIHQAILHQVRGSAMGSNSENCVLIANAGARARRLSSDEVVEVSQDGEVPWSSPVRKRQLRVLVADDYQDAADCLSMLVAIWGHKVWV